MKTITGRQINVTPNHGAQTFTIRTDVAKYRTNRMSKEEFKSCLNNTANDWQCFLDRSDDYCVVNK
jgi:hypothetical protein